MGRAPCCDKMGMKKGPWTHEEDQILVSYVEQFGHGNWRALPKLAGLLRCGKSCRLRWMNYLRPDIKRGNFTREEEQTIIELHKMLGNRWSAIAAKLPGRTDNEIKNVWHTHLKKRLNVNDTNTSNSSSSLTHHEHDHRSPIVEDDTGITGRQRDIISHCRSKSVDVLTKESESENGSDSSVSIKYSSKTTKADTSENCYALEQPSEDFWSQMLSSNVMFSGPYESGIEVESLSKVDRVPYYEDATMQGLGDERDFWCNMLSKMGEFPELLEI